jgi:hypothetical protein
MSVSSSKQDDVIWLSAGKHRLRDMDGIVVVECQGEIFFADARAMTPIFSEVSSREGCFLLLLNLANGGMPGPAARKHLVDWTGDRRGATACIGRSSTLNTVAMLLNRAVRLVHRNSMPMEAFKSQEKAVAWLRGQQRALIDSGYVIRQDEPTDGRKRQKK